MYLCTFDLDLFYMIWAKPLITIQGNHNITTNEDILDNTVLLRNSLGKTLYCPCGHFGVAEPVWPGSQLHPTPVGGTGTLILCQTLSANMMWWGELIALHNEKRNILILVNTTLMKSHSSSSYCIFMDVLAEWWNSCHSATQLKAKQHNTVERKKTRMLVMIK